MGSLSGELAPSLSFIFFKRQNIVLVLSTNPSPVWPAAYTFGSSPSSTSQRCNRHNIGHEKQLKRSCPAAQSGGEQLVRTGVHGVRTRSLLSDVGAEIPLVLVIQRWS